MTATLSLFPPACGLRQLSAHWFQAVDGDEFSRELFNRHYSRRFYRDGRKPKLFVGPGQKLVLLNYDGSSIFIWRKFIDAIGQQAFKKVPA